MNSMHSLIWFYDIEALTVFQLSQLAGGSGQDQFGATSLAQQYLQQWLLIVAVLFGVTVVLGLYGLFHHRLNLPGMRPITFNIVTIVAMVISLAVFLEAEPRFLNSTVATVNQILVRDLGDEMSRSSNDLSRMARQYALTGDAQFRDYFDEILAIRNGEAPRPLDYGRIPWWDLVLSTGDRPGESGEAIALATLIEESGVVPEKKAMLQAALEQADSLAALEREAIVLVDSQVATDGGFVFSNAAQAITLLHGPEYHVAKASLAGALAEASDTSLDAEVSVGLSLVQDQRNRLEMLQVAIFTMVAAILANLAANYGGRKRQRANAARIRELEARLEQS